MQLVNHTRDLKIPWLSKSLCAIGADGHSSDESEAEPDGVCQHLVRRTKQWRSNSFKQVLKGLAGHGRNFFNIATVDGPESIAPPPEGTPLLWIDQKWLQTRINQSNVQ
jgi:hypothetical protein